VDDQPDHNPTTDEELSEADIEAQEADDNLKEAAAIEANNRRWLEKVTAVINLVGYTDPMIDQDVRGAIDRTIILACERANRLLTSDLPAGR